MTLRLCHPTNYQGLYEYKEDDDKFHGPFGEEQRRIIERHMKEAISNITVQIQSNQGVGELDETTGQYDGCVGMLQKNQSDLIMMMYEYPIEGDHLKQGVIIYDTSLVIGSTYVKVDTGPSAQLLDSFQAFSAGVWTLCLLVPIFLAAILKLREKFRRLFKPSERSNYHLYHSFTQCTRTGEIPPRNRVNKICFMCAAIFSLVVVHYFSTLIKTQLVVIKDPDLFSSYQDVMDAKAVPYFIKGMAYSNYFSRKKAPAFRKKLWNYAVNTFGEENLWIDLVPISFLLLALKTLKRESVVILETVLMPVVPGTACPLNDHDPIRIRDGISVLSDVDRLAPFLDTQGLDDATKAYAIRFLRREKFKFDSIPDIMFHIAPDPNEAIFSQGLLQSPHTSEPIKKQVDIILRRAIELGFNIKTIKNLVRYNLLENNQMVTYLAGKKLNSRSHLVEECFSETIVKPEIETHALNLENLESLGLVMASLFMIAFVILLFEILLAKFTKNKRRSQPRRLRLRMK